MTKKRSTMAAGQPEDIWRNRMIGTDIVDADQLLANPDNWRHAVPVIMSEQYRKE